MPWLGYLDKMDQADCFVVLDVVQFKKNEWQNRNRIKAVNGPQWLTVPVLHQFPSRLLDVQVNRAVRWQHKHLQALRTNYARASAWAAAWPDLEGLYAADPTGLVEANLASVEWLRGRLEVTTPLCRASAMALPEEPTARLVAICRAVGADTYLSGADGRNYMDLSQFATAGIKVLFQRYQPEPYPQLFGAFASHLSALDLVLNCGGGAADIFRRGRRPPEPA
jgi:hypothetical protein